VIEPTTAEQNEEIDTIYRRKFSAMRRSKCNSNCTQKCQDSWWYSTTTMICAINQNEGNYKEVGEIKERAKFEANQKEILQIFKELRAVEPVMKQTSPRMLKYCGASYF
jgi:hypothetical protein